MCTRPCKVIFPFLVLEVTENGVQRAECIMEGEVCVQDHKLADTYVDSSPGSFLEERGLSPPPVFRGESLVTRLQAGLPKKTRLPITPAILRQIDKNEKVTVQRTT